MEEGLVMNKVYVNKETNLVEQIINIDVDPNWSEGWFPWCYVVDDEDNSLKHHGYKYNLETEEFEEIEDYQEPEVVIEPSKSEVAEEKVRNLEMELYLTQSAVDFLLMSSISDVSLLNTKEKEGGMDIMAGYLAMRIIKGMLSYKEVVTKYPEYKEEIDFILKAEGKHDLIIQL